MRLSRLLAPKFRSARHFARDFWQEAMEERVANGAAALAYYFLLALFPALIFCLSLLPYLPLPTLQESIMEYLFEVLPHQTAALLGRTVAEVLTEKRSALLSFGALFTLWSSSAGLRAVIQQVNYTYHVRETRPIWQTWVSAALLMVAFAFPMVAGLSVLFLGDVARNILALVVDYNPVLLFAFQVMRWSIVGGTLTLAFLLTYYYGPDVEQRVRFVLPGAAFAAACFGLVSLGFKLYVSLAPSLSATYGSLGAVIALMIWLHLLGWVVVLGSELNALIERRSVLGKKKGERFLPAHQWQAAYQGKRHRHPRTRQPILPSYPFRQPSKN